MKAEVYIFGNFTSGYSQYPDNYTHNLFEQIGKTRKSESEIIYHRDGSLTYYIYTREISKKDNTFIGLCYVFNDVFIKDFDSLFSVFEDVITIIVTKGGILEFTKEGKLSTKINQLYAHTEELQRITDYLNSKILLLNKYIEKLPPLNLATSKLEWKEFIYKDTNDIKTAILEYSNIRITKGENYNTEALTSYSNILNTLNKEKNNALQTITKQKQEISELKKKQKNYLLVIWLIVIVFIVGLIGIGSVNSRNAIIQRLEGDIVDKENIIDTQDKNIKNLNDLVSEHETTIEQQHYEIGFLISYRDSILDVNKNLNKKVETLQIEKTELNKTLTSKETELNKSRKEINSLKNQNKNLVTENTQLKNKKIEPEKYTVYAKSGNKAYYYYKKEHYYNKTGVSEKDYTTIYVYYKENGYALTSKGYIKLEDIRKVN